MHIWQEEEKMTRTASEDFKKNLEGGFRYVDKTELLIPLLNREHETTYWHYDTAEAFYHGVLLMLMQLNGDYFCESSRESGNGRFLVMARRKVRQDLAFILEVKVSSAMEERISDAEKAAAHSAL